MFESATDSRTRGCHSLKLREHRSRLYLRKYCFPEKVVNRWNDLDEYTTSATTVNVFKIRLQRFREHKASFFTDTQCSIQASRLHLEDHLLPVAAAPGNSPGKEQPTVKGCRNMQPPSKLAATDNLEITHNIDRKRTESNYILKLLQERNSASEILLTGARAGRRHNYLYSHSRGGAFCVISSRRAVISQPSDYRKANRRRIETILHIVFKSIALVLGEEK